MTVEIEQTYTRADAERDLQLMRDGVDALRRLGAVDAAARMYANQGWVQFGYSSWDAFCATEVGGLVALPRPDRREAVATMTEAGMSTRAIGAALGVSHPTVLSDQRDAGGKSLPPEPTAVTGLDGKTYTRQERPTRTVTVVEEVTVDAETGEIVAPTADEYVSQFPDMRKANLRKEFSRWTSGIAPTVGFDPEELAGIVGNDELKVMLLRSAVRRATEWLEQFDAAVESNRGLRLVKGSNQ